jgi:hypothetical protein
MGMKVVCINNGEMDGAMESSVNLTLGKVYEALGDVTPNDSVFNIINDIGNRGSYYFGRFTTLDEVRHNKLEKLGI